MTTAVIIRLLTNIVAATGEFAMANFLLRMNGSSAKNLSRLLGLFLIGTGLYNLGVGILFLLTTLEWVSGGEWTGYAYIGLNWFESAPSIALFAYVINRKSLPKKQEAAPQ